MHGNRPHLDINKTKKVVEPEFKTGCKQTLVRGKWIVESLPRRSYVDPAEAVR